MLRNIKNFRHLLWIGITLARHDALFPVALLNIPSLTLLTKIFRRRKKNLTKGQRLAEAFIALGPTFIKLGQGFSTRSDLVGEEIARELAVLRDQLPPFSSKTAVAIIELELGDKIENLFKSFDKKPVAAASIAQVHFAKMKNGEDVAVKILRPNIRKIIAKDIALFYWIAKIIVKRNPAYAARLRPMEIVKIVEETIKNELDLRMEAASASLLRQNFAGRSDIKFYVPKIYWSHSSEKVMVIEKVGGTKIDERGELIKNGFNPDEILANASKALFRQVFDDGFFHADLHPGNVFVNERGEIVPIDFGIMGYISQESRIYIAEILGGFLSRDYMRVARAHFDAGYVPKTKSLEMFALACRSVGEPVMDLPINEISLSRLLASMFKVAEDFEMIAQPQLLLLQKTMMMAEGVGRSLNPNVNMWKLAEPLVADWVRKTYSPKAKIKELINFLRENAHKIPEFLDRVLRR